MIKILFLDDDLSLIRMLKTAFQNFNPDWNFTFCSDASDYVDKANDYDLVFLDIAMPKINGLDFIFKIEKKSILEKIVIITGLPDPEIMQLAFSAGITKCIYKPITRDIILNCINEFFENNED